MKRTICLIYLLITSFICYAQSPELKDCYNKVVSTLREYVFYSEDVHRFVYDMITPDMYQTKSLSLKISNGLFIISFDDAYKTKECYIYGAKPGEKTISVPINELKIEYASTWITFSGTNGIEYIYNKKKELLRAYRLYASDLTTKKLYNELCLLQDKVISEQFNGKLGSVSEKTISSKSSRMINTSRNMVIKMKKMKGNTYLISCKVNGLPLDFIFDTGASSVTLSRKQATFMLKNGYLSKSDIIGTNAYQTATGDIAIGAVVKLKKIDINGLILNNVEASIINSDSAPLLLGQSALSRLGKIQIDYKNSTLTIIR